MCNFSKNIIMTILLSCLSLSVFADDIDIINEEPIDINTNILFIMDVSGSMEWDVTTAGVVPADPADSRLGILKSAMATLLNDPDMVDVNVGLSSFAGNTTVSTLSQTAHGISYPVSDIDADAEMILDQNPLFDHPGDSFLPPTGGVTTRGYFQTISNTWTPYGGTPIVDALFEAALYFKGLETNWGRHDPSKIRAAHPSTYVGLLKDVTTTATAYVCNDVPCSGASCNATSTCTTAPQTSSCSTPTCGDVCTPVTTTQTCGTGVNSCGNGANCSPTTYTYTRDCITNSAWLCQLAHPTWYACNSVSTQSCVTTCPDGLVDEFGSCINPQTSCNNSTHQQCKEDISSYQCDANTYQCTSDVESCEHEVCGNVTTNVTTLTGTATFVSPIKEKCPANGIILLSDGAPSVNLSATLASNMIGPTYHNSCDAGVFEGRCGPELTKYMANEDMNTSIVGDQSVKTFTIGLALSGDPTAEDYLKSLAAAGDGDYLRASSSASLVGAFKAAIAGIADKKARSFSSPSYTINSTNLLTNDNIVYVPVFDRVAKPVWVGNLKKFELNNGELYGLDNGGVKVKAMDADGALKSDVRDFWATAASTNAVESGGAASLINPATRKAYTDNGSGLVPISSASEADLNAADAAEKTKLVDYILGKNSDGTARHFMGDIIHSTPTELTYGGGSKVVFVGSNEGYLHAIDGSTGQELFAYMPKELLKNVKKQYDSVYSDQHMYGVDGPITLWIDESSSAVSNGKLDAGEKAYIFFGLRRGGKSYYALNVTNPSSPQLVWKISNTGGFSDLGFTWSTPKVAMLKYKSGGTVSSTAKPVLVFGGGYVNDHGGEAVNSGTGANVYMVDAETGQLLLKIGGSLSHAIPGSIRVIDINRDGSDDRLYFGDTGGNVWRVDLNGDSSDPYNLSGARLTKLAQLGGTGANERMFFTEPDVAIFKHTGNFAITVSIGSGDRTSPLETTIDDHFFMMLDKNVFKVAPSSSLPIVLGDLYDAPVPTGTNLVANLHNTGSKKGWKMKLNITNLVGEKVMAAPLTFQNMVMFTTFGLKSVNTSTYNNVTCLIENVNRARLYALDLLSGEAAMDLNGDSSISNSADSSVEVSSGEILGPPQLIYGDFGASGGGACTETDCKRSFEIHAGNNPKVAGSETKVANPIPSSKQLPRAYWIDKKQ